MTELTRLVRPAQPQSGPPPSSKERHAEGIKNFVYRNLVVSHKKGWIAAIQHNVGTFSAILSPLSDLRKSMKEAGSDISPFVSQRTLSFSTSEPNLLAFACNDSRLIVGFKSGQIIAYDTSSVLTPGSNEISPLHILQSSQQPILDITSNPNDEDPNLSNLLATVRADGTVQVLNANLESQGGWVAGNADSTPVAGAWDEHADDRLLVVVGDMSCTDLEVIGNIGNEWYQQSQENPLSIPLDKESEDTVLLSLQVDFTDTDPTEGGHPIIYAYLNDGTLQGWYVDHPEKKPYGGMVGASANISTSTSTSSQPQHNPAFGAQSSSSSAFSNAQAPSPGQTSATTAFGHSSFGRTGFVVQPATESTSNYGPSNSSGGFANYSSNSASPFGPGDFASSASNTSSFGNTTIESSPQITRDASMSDSTPAFVGLSLGDSSESPKPTSTFNGTGNMFGSPSPLPLPPTHPANQPAQTSVFGSGSGNVIKPATGFGAFGGPTSGSFGVFGNTGNTTNNAFTGGAFSAQPTKTSAFASNSEQSRPGSGFGQPSFGQSSFGKPSFGQPTFAQLKPAEINPSSGGFSAFSQSPTSFMSAAPSSPMSKSNAGGDGFASFAGTPSTFASAMSSGKSAFGGVSASGTDNTKEQKSESNSFSAFASKGPSPFGQSENKTPSPFGSQSPSGGAFSNFASNGPSVFGKPVQMGTSVFGGTKSESHSVFEQPSAGSAFGALKSVSSSVFGQPAPSTSQVAFRDRESVPSTHDHEKEHPVSLIKSEPGSPTLPSSPDSDIVKPSTFPVKATTTGNLQTSSSYLKPASGFGAFGNTMPNSSPFLRDNTDDEKPAVSPFGSLGSAKSVLSTNLSSPSTDPTFGATSQLGFGFGLKASTSSSSPVAASTSSATTTPFSAFSGTPSPFAAVGGTTKSFGDLLKEGSPKATSEPPKFASSTPPASPSAAAKQIRDGDKTVPGDEEKRKMIEDTNEESVLSTSSSYVEIPRPAKQEDEEEKVPDSDDELEGHLEQHGHDDDDDDEGDFLSESFDSHSGEEQLEEGESEEVEGKESSDEPSPSSSPEPTEIPLPPSRSRSNTPQAETPRTEPNSPSPSTSEDTESSRLSTIREESTTPPGTPTKSQTTSSSAILAPAPINAPLTTLGIGRPSTRPTRSSPLANKPLTGAEEQDDEEEAAEEPKLIAAFKARPASPKAPFGMIPTHSGSTSPDEPKLIDGKRPKTPPLLSNFFGSTSTPTTPKPAAASLPGPATPLKPPPGQLTPLSNTSVAGPPSPSFSSNSLFDKPFSLQPATGGVDLAVPKVSSVFTPPPSGFFGGITQKLDSGSRPQPSLPPFPAGSQPGTSPILSPGTPKPLFSLPPPFTPPPPAGPSIPSAPAVSIRSSGTTPVPLPVESGMQKECHMLVDMMHIELERLRALAGAVAKKRELLSKSAGGSRRKEDLGNHEKWTPCDSAQFGALLRQFEQDIFELKDFAGKQKADIREIGKSMIKAGTRREEIARFNKAKSDNEFSKMLKSRTLGPEHLENQTQLRRNIRAMRTKVDQLEDQLRAHKKRLSEVNTGRPTLKPPSLDTIHRTYRNIDIALQQQTDEVAQLSARFLKLNVAASTYNSPATRDPRLPSFSPRSRPSILTPDVAT
ncbi:hypothetical protein LENED_007680 [Lentinula edodes]|uniref:Nucleoporin Nup159/Nup146 N-terminal domain-containing protein n=1 Tax=Lentinula edodes TaxID=5353 RepID=A0A1Q3EF15_LENED|nr:hypothetical protein LENED_007680 [Lentinula edodes]